MSGNAIGQSASAAEAATLRNMQANAAMSVKVLKKALDSDKQMMAQLLEPLHQGKVDIRT